MHVRSLMLGAVAALALAACGGGDDSADTTLPEITLLTTTTEAPVFETTTAPDATTTTEPAETTTVPTTTVAPTTLPADTTTTTEAPPASPFSLETDGIGAASFGAAPDGVIDFVSSVLGPPTSDTGWVDPFEIGPCGGTQLRQVGWNDLLLEFGDVSNIAQGRPHFYGYYYGNGVSGSATPAGLATAEGLSVGSTVADLLAAYPEAALFSGDEFLGPNFFVNDALRGTMSGLADSDVITSWVGGLPCSG